MSAESVLHAALVTALRDADALRSALNGVFDGPPVQATPPFAEVQPMLAIDWGMKDRAGRELRPAVIVRDAAETPARLHALADAVVAAVATMPRDPDGWRVASSVFVRSRMLREAPGRWAMAIEFRVRMMEG
ncbi:DUF3168 domain-containing protein [Hephaestia sp. GCM10023244]|uniref:tail completion protein gp17 n=1 Tax=unclassified Hephaestia TaxID=2631281 RepID=UPI0020775E06|nr:DUF3168 domain-containing protein [Hephaestia sp. MAHUQ-44]MCM8729702.1 DUF3168 domain-containing protein [Hephaestia sp. MAHUQ-44]